MSSFTDDENNEYLLCTTYLADSDALPVTPPDHLVIQAPAFHRNSPLKTVGEALILNDMFALFLSTREPGCLIAASGGFGADGLYHVVGAGNPGGRGVRRPTDELCTALAHACTQLIRGNMEPPNLNNIGSSLPHSIFAVSRSQDDSNIFTWVKPSPH